MKKIKDLSWDELLGIIYHNLPKTLFDVHPVACASCNNGSPEPTQSLVSVEGRIVQPMFYICDRCNEAE